jgi:hypothetical protein
MLHIQKTVPRWTECLPLLPSGSMLKATSGYEIFSEAWALNSGLFTVVRQVRPEFEQYYGTTSSGWFDWDIARQHARTFFNAMIDGTFMDRHQYYTRAVSWHNEIWADSQNQVERDERVKAAEAATWVWGHEFRPLFDHDIQLIIGEAAVGNGMPRRIAELAIEEDNIVGYHPYEHWRFGNRSDYEYRRYTSLRFDMMEKEWGLSPEWAFTEAGPYESAVTGWRAKECLNGDRAAYVEAVRLWIRDVMKTNAAKQDRIRGFGLFTTFAPNDQKWGTFHTEQPELNDLARMVREEWHPGDDPVINPPIDPPVDDEFEQKAWEVTVEKQVTGQGGLRLNANAAIQRQVNIDNLGGLNLQIVTDEVLVDGKVVQAVESLTKTVPRRVYVWEAGKEIYYFEEG